MTTESMTKDEGELVLRLLELWDSAWDNPHAKWCNCDLCEKLERSGEWSCTVFDSLKLKAEEAAR